MGVREERSVRGEGKSVRERGRSVRGEGEECEGRERTLRLHYAHLETGRETKW